MMLEKEEFMEFYLNSCQNKEGIVRQNLYAHNYKINLRKEILNTDDEY